MTSTEKSFGTVLTRLNLPKLVRLLPEERAAARYPQLQSGTGELRGRYSVDALPSAEYSFGGHGPLFDPVRRRGS